MIVWRCVLAALCIAMVVGGNLSYADSDYYSDLQLLKGMREEMAGIASLVREYARRRGRLPKYNDLPRWLDGVATVARFNIDANGLVPGMYYYITVRRISRAREQGRCFPGTKADFLEMCPSLQPVGPQVTGVEVLVPKQGGAYLLYQGMILSPFYVPYCFDLPGATGQGGGLGGGIMAGMYSVGIAKEARVVSPGGIVVWEKKIRTKWVTKVATLLCLLLLWMAFVGVVVRKRRMSGLRGGRRWLVVCVVLSASLCVGSWSRVEIVLRAGSRFASETTYRQEAETTYKSWVHTISHAGGLDKSAEDPLYRAGGFRDAVRSGGEIGCDSSDQPDGEGRRDY